VTPGITSAPGLDSILVDSAGDVIITGQAGTNAAIGTFPPAPAPSVSSSESFMLKLDPAGAKILGGISAGFADHVEDVTTAAVLRGESRGNDLDFGGGFEDPIVSYVGAVRKPD
jgi:hypothetical protein